MDFIIIILTILTVILLFQVRSIRRSVKSYEVDVFSLQSRLETLRREIESLIGITRAARGGEAAPGKPATAPPAAAPQPLLQPLGAYPPPVTPAPAPVPPVSLQVPTEPPAPKPVPVAAADIPAARQPVPAPAAAEPSAAMTSVKTILAGIWRWILVGDEYRVKGVTMEYAVATTWLMRAGIIAIVACVGYFLNWSIAHGLVGPWGRVGIAIFFGVGLLATGTRLLGRRWDILGQGFIGGGLATLYFSMFAAGPLFKLLPIPAAFLLMVLVTVAAGVLALCSNSMLVAIFGIVGGFATPVLLHTAEPNLPALFGYMLLLNLGILGIAYYKQWRLLNYLGFILTWLLFFGALGRYERSDFQVTIVFLSLFFLVQALLVYLYNLSRKIRTTALEIAHLMLNAVLFSGQAYWLIRDAVGRPWPAVMTLALSAFYILHVIVFLNRRILDRPLLVALVALSGFYLALTMPLAVEKESLTICWSLLAFMFLWIGASLKSNFIRYLGYGLYLIVLGRLLSLDVPRNFGFDFARSAEIAPMAVYWKAMLGRLWTFGIAIASVAGAFILELKRPPAAGAAIAPVNDVPDLVPAAALRHFFFWSGLLAAFLFLQLEFNAMFHYYEPLRPAVLTLLWCGMAALMLGLFLAGRGPQMFVALCVFLGAAVIKTVSYDLAAWKLCDQWIFDIGYSPGWVLGRWLDFGTVLLILALAWRLLGRRPDGRSAARVFGYGGLALLFLYGTLEINTLLHWHLFKFQAGGISAFWALFAIVFVAGGIWKNVAPLRFAGLALFAVVFAKVFLVDLAAMLMIYRVVAFMIVGVFLILGAFAYLYSSSKFRKDESQS